MSGPAGRWLLTSALVTLLTLAHGCTTRNRARAEVERAYHAGQASGLKEAGKRERNIFFSGPVQNPLVPWTENLTLAQGLLAAHWLAAEAPRLIVLKRGEAQTEMTGQQLLAGEDILLLPGDIIELQP
jgi:hypothetical protein